MRQAQEVELDGFLMKPVNPSVLLDTILEVFGKASTDSSIKSSQPISDTKGLDRIRGARILLVEDNEINQQVARELLEREGFVVEIANDGQEGVNRTHSSEYDVILMDIQMPVMGGYEAASLISSDPRFDDLPILAMTANTMVGDREKALAAGMKDHIAKPIDPNQLYAALSKWVKPGDRELPDGYLSSNRSTEKKDEPSEDFPTALPGIDITTGISRVGGNIKLYRNLLNKFSQNQSTFTEDIKVALEQGDIELAERLAHTIKGVSGNIGAMVLHVASRDLESGIKEHGVDVAADLLALVQTHLEQVLNSISTLDDADDAEMEPTEEMDLAKIKPMIEELKALLEDDDTEAANVVEKLQARLKGTEAGLALSKVEKCIGDYDFEEALEELETLFKKLC